MDVLIYSDTHIEFGAFKPERYGVVSDAYDVVLLAGDIGPGTSGLAWAQQTFPGAYYIAGNHEFYGHNLDKHYDKMRNRASQVPEGMRAGPVNFLHNDVVYGVTKSGEKYRVLGATFWTNFMYDQGVMPLEFLYTKAEHALNDFRYVTTNDGRLTGQRVHDEHKASYKFLFDELNKDFDGKTIVMTHHAPSPKSISEQFKNSPYNNLYVSDYDEDIMILGNIGPDLWVHGHVHSSQDYYLGKTRVVANPRGYTLRSGQPENPNFNPNLVIRL